MLEAVARVAVTLGHQQPLGPDIDSLSEWEQNSTRLVLQTGPFSRSFFLSVARRGLRRRGDELNTTKVRHAHLSKGGTS